MSKRARQKQAARVVREQLARERRRQRNMWITIGAVVVLVTAGLVGWSVSQAQKPDTFQTPAGVAGDGAALVAAGEGPVTVEVYLDFLCPACRQFEESSGPTLDQLLAANKIKLVWHTLAILDRLSTTDYSTRSAASAGCASDGGRLKEYGEALYAQQPAEGGPGLSDDQLLEIGRSVGLTDPAFERCVRDGRYKSWVAHVTDLAARRGVNGTPTIYINNQLVENRTPEGIQAAVDAAA